MGVFMIGSAQKLICIDFDQTIVNAHFHASLMEQEITPITEELGVQIYPHGSLEQERATIRKNVYDHISEWLKDPLMGPKNGDEMLQSIRQALAHNHKI